MNRKLKRIKTLFWFLFDDEKCEHCHGKLKRYGDDYYGGVDIHDTIGGKARRTAYICNLCKTLFKV